MNEHSVIYRWMDGCLRKEKKVIDELKMNK